MTLERELRRAQLKAIGLKMTRRPVSRRTLVDAAKLLLLEVRAADSVADRIRALHEPREQTTLGQLICRTCHIPHPCPTIRALNG